MTALVPFDYSGRQVRTVQVAEEPWFVAADVCAALSLRDVSSALKMVDDEDKQLFRRSDTPQFFGGIAPQVQELWFVNESGLFALIFQSNKREAREFKSFVTHEVLPAIRKTGSYGAGLPALPDMSTAEGQLQVIEAWRTSIVTTIEQASQIKALQPKADYVDGFVGATTDATLLRVLANQLGVKEADLRDLLVQRKVIYRKLEGSRFSRSKGRQIPEYSWHAYSDYSSWFVERDQPEAPRLHNGQMRTTLYVTPVGKVKVADLIAKAGAA